MAISTKERERLEMLARSLLCGAVGLAMMTPSAHGAQCSAFEMIKVFRGSCPTRAYGDFQSGGPQTSQTYRGLPSGGARTATTYSARPTTTYRGVQSGGALRAPTSSARSTPTSGGLLFVAAPPSARTNPTTSGFHASGAQVFQASADSWRDSWRRAYGWGWGYGGWGWGYGRVPPWLFRPWGHRVVSRH
jgi:hypothetical protein